jgi:hypothetical protein
MYNCCWSSPAQSFSGQSTAGLMTTFYCFKFQTSPTWRARSPYLYPPGTGWPSYTPRHWITFRRLLRLAGLRWRYSTPPPHGIAKCFVRACCIPSSRTAQKTPLPIVACVSATLVYLVITAQQRV